MPDIAPTYRAAMLACAPIVRGWGRLRVTGLELLPETGPSIVCVNHDSYWDPIAVGVGALSRRQVRALAKDSLWRTPGLAPILNGMGQIPVIRGANDVAAMERAVQELAAGACIGVFPEGTRSKGSELRARGGIGRLVRAVPETTVVCAAIVGTVDIPRFPVRPRVTVDFFAPAGGSLQADESDSEFAARLLGEIRARAPHVAAGRRRAAA